MTTTIKVFNEASYRDATLEVPFALDETVQRLRAAIGEPDFNISLFGTTFVYGRVVGQAVHLYFYGSDCEEVQGELNRITAEVEGRVPA